MKHLSAIVAMSQNGVIGRDGRLPWQLSADLRRFKQLTMGHHLIMGRKTYASIGRPLPGRTTIVVTRQTDAVYPGVLVAQSLDEAYRLAGADDEPFVIGGGEIYRQSMPDIDRLYVTLVQAHVDGDTYFPDIDWNEWKLMEEVAHGADERNSHPTLYRVYHRLRPRERMDP